MEESYYYKNRYTSISLTRLNANLKCLQIKCFSCLVLFVTLDLADIFYSISLLKR